MFKQFTNFNYLFHPETPTGSGSGNGNSSTIPFTNIPSGKDRTVGDIEKFLSDDEEKPELLDLSDKKDKKDKKDKTDTKTKSKGKEDEKEDDETEEEDIEDDEEDSEEDEDDELDEIEDELEEPDDEKLELTTPVRRKEILKKYPQLFKDFPYLEKAYYREQQFTELLPTIDDAKEAVEKSKALDNFEQDLMNGNSENIFKAIKGADEKSFYKLADNLMPMLAKVDKDVHTHICGNIIKSLIVAMVQEGRKSGNEALQNSAAIVNQFLFGSSDFTPASNLYKEEKKDDKEDKISQREKEFTTRRLNENVEDLNSKVNNSYKKYINDNIDPKDSMPEYVKKSAIRDTLEDLQKVMESDKRFKVLTDKLWEKAIKSEFSRDSLDTIKRAFHSKAKTVLPTLIQKARITALKGIGKRVKETVEDNDDNETAESNNSTVRRTQSRSNTSNTRREPPSSRNNGRRPGESTADFLMRD